MGISRLLQNFLARLTLLTVMLAVVAYGLAYLQPSLNLPALLPALLAYFFVFTLLVHGILIVAGQDRTEMSIAYFIATITGKLLVSLIVIGLLAYLFPEQMVGLVISFFILYIIFTVFEIISLLPILTGNNNGK